MKTDQKQFNSSLETLKSARLSSDAKNRILSEIVVYARAHIAVNRVIPSPYFPVISFFRKPVSVVLLVMFFVSGGTAFAAEPSLPGDFLYPIKTKITEPLIKLTKAGAEAKASFDLALADKRIEEMQKLIETGAVTEEKTRENFSLFKKHLQQYEDEENLQGDTAPEHASNITLRLEHYQDLVLSVPELNNLYESPIKTILQPIAPTINMRGERSKLENADLENKHDSSITKEGGSPQKMIGGTTTPEKINTDSGVEMNLDGDLFLHDNPILDEIRPPALNSGL